MATKWGVVTAGKICHDFVTAVRSLPGNDHQVIQSILKFQGNQDKDRLTMAHVLGP